MSDIHPTNGSDSESKQQLSIPADISGAGLAQMNLSEGTDMMDNSFALEATAGIKRKLSTKRNWKRGNIRIKYSGYGEEYAIQKIKNSESATENLRFKNLRRKRSDPGCYIDPHTTFMKRWDPYMTLLLLYTALVTPYEVAFLGSPETWEARAADPLWVFNQFVNISFPGGIIDPRVRPFCPCSPQNAF